MVHKKHIIVFFVILQMPFSFCAPSLNSNICTINSKVDVIHASTSNIEHIVCTIESTTITIESNIDIIQQENNTSLEAACTLESLIDVIDMDVISLDSKIDDVDNQYLTIQSHFDVVNSFIEITVCSKLEFIDSFVDSTILHSKTIESTLDTADPLVSSIDQVLSGSSTLEATWCTVDRSIDITESIIDLMLEYTNSVASTVISIESQVDTAILQSQTIESVVDIINLQLFTDVSLADVVESKICDIESKIELLDTTIQEVNMLLGQANDSSNQLSIDFQETWTLLQALRNSLIAIESNTDVICDDINTIEFIFDQTEVFTAIKHAESIVCTVENSIDALQLNINEIQDLAYYETYTALQAVIDKLAVSDSLIDEVKITATVIDSIQECLGTPITQADVGTTGYTIPSFGKYYLAEDIEFNPIVAATAISNTIPGVTIDLNGKTLSQGNATAGVTGIRSTVAATTIRNGTIKNFNSLAANLSNNNVIEGVTIDNGRLFLDRPGHQIRNCIFKNRDRALDAGSAFSGEVTVEDCCFMDIAGTGAIFAGADSQDFNNRRNVFRRCKFINVNTAILASIADSVPRGGFFIDDCIFIACGNGVLTAGLGDTGKANPSTIRKSIFINCTTGVNFNFNGHNVIKECLFIRCGIGILFGSGTPLSIVAFNTFIENSSYGVRNNFALNQAIIGNFAFNSTSETINYSTSGTTVPKVILSETAAFPSPASATPTFWHNISMTP